MCLFGSAGKPAVCNFRLDVLCPCVAVWLARHMASWNALEPVQCMFSQLSGKHALTCMSYMTNFQ